MFIMVEGIDGSGKGTIVRLMAEHLATVGKSIFNLSEWAKTNGRLPKLDEIGAAEVVVGGEPTHAWIGAAIRQEMIRNGHGYATADIATAFSLDRLTLYHRSYLPALDAGKWIIAERGVASSLVYQPAADASVTLEYELALSGNAFTLEHAPDHLVIAKIDPNTAVERLAKRDGKQDDHIYERADFLKQISGRYESDWLRELFESRGTKIHFIDTNGSLEETQQQTISLLESLI